MQKLSLFLGLGAVAVGVAFSSLAVVALADPQIGAAVSLVFGAIAAAFLAVAHRAMRTSGAAGLVAVAS